MWPRMHFAHFFHPQTPHHTENTHKRAETFWQLYHRKPWRKPFWCPENILHFQRLSPLLPKGHLRISATAKTKSNSPGTHPPYQKKNMKTPNQKDAYAYLLRCCPRSSGSVQEQRKRESISKISFTEQLKEKLLLPVLEGGLKELLAVVFEPFGSLLKQEKAWLIKAWHLKIIPVPIYALMKLIYPVGGKAETWDDCCA